MPCEHSHGDASGCTNHHGMILAFTAPPYVASVLHSSVTAYTCTHHICPALKGGCCSQCSHSSSYMVQVIRGCVCHMQKVIRAHMSRLVLPMLSALKMLLLPIHLLRDQASHRQLSKMMLLWCVRVCRSCPTTPVCLSYTKPAAASVGVRGEPIEACPATER